MLFRNGRIELTKSKGRKNSGGLIAIGLALVDHIHQLSLPIGFVYSPLFWFGYVAILTAATIVKFVRQQEVLVIERLGRYNRTLTAGINIVWPIVERVAYIFDLREQVMDVPAQDAITRDNATVTIDGILYYKIVHARDAAYGAEDIRRAIINLAQTTMRSAIGSMELDKTFEQRAEINDKVVKAVAEAAQTWGAQVTRYEIKDIKMPRSLLESMERQMKAERDKRAVVLESEGFKQSQINRADGERQAAILRSEGEQQAAINVAQGQAEAIRLVRDQIKQAGGSEAVQLEVQNRHLSNMESSRSKATLLSSWAITLTRAAGSPRQWRFSKPLVPLHLRLPQVLFHRGKLEREDKMDGIIDNPAILFLIGGFVLFGIDIFIIGLSP